MWERPTLTVDLTILWAGEEKDGGAGFLSLLPDCWCCDRQTASSSCSRASPTIMGCTLRLWFKKKIFPSVNCLYQVFYPSNKTKNLNHSLTSDSSPNVLLGPHSPKEAGRSTLVALLVAEYQQGGHGYHLTLTFSDGILSVNPSFMGLCVRADVWNQVTTSKGGTTQKGPQASLFCQGSLEHALTETRTWKQHWAVALHWSA